MPETKNRSSRPSWDDYFFQLAEVVSSRSTCLRRQVGALLVRDNRILTTGYNGAPAGVAHCQEAGCLRNQLNIPSGEKQELCRGLHAEQNAVVQAALHGVDTSGATAYVTIQPCLTCMKILINAGIKKIVYQGDYPDPLAVQIAREAKMILSKMEVPVA
ncbi:MAG TPA: cytidine deaminase [Cyanobacteria bacterium UBA8530]|nr:cytidine deaminase [Cyanobacteria bacterium UBA8530]